MQSTLLLAPDTLQTPDSSRYPVRLTIVTVATVGYGNITVTSIPARLAIIFVLVYGLITLSNLIEKLAAALSGRGAHQLSFVCV